MTSVSPQTVFVTGGNRGLGLEMVKQLTELKEPPKIIFATYRKVDGAKELFKLAETKKSIRPLQLDVQDTASYAKIVDDVSDVVGKMGLNLLINNAAFAPLSGLENISKEELLEVFEVNTVAPTLLTRAFTPLLKKGSENSRETAFTWSRATVVNISSDVGSIANTNSTEYGAYAYRMSKAALNMSTKLLSLDLKEHHILVVSVHPGWVQTDMGGPDAPLTKHDSISSILSTFEKLTVANNGSYISFDGKPIEY